MSESYAGKINRKLLKKRRIINAAAGREPADLVLKNATYVNVFSNELCHADIAVAEGLIVGMGQYSGTVEEDCTGKIVLPGFLDAHIHLESSLVSPKEFVKAVLPHGTTTVITDPHEIANVMGTDGIEYMLQATEDLPVDVRFMLPSCVPATPLDESGAVLDYRAIDSFYDHPRVQGLAEMMNFVGIIAGDDQPVEKIVAAQAHHKKIDGHAPDLVGNDLNAYIAAGVYSDHECHDLNDAIAKLERGQFIMIREGTAARNLEALAPLLCDKYSERCMFCTDDKHPSDLLEKGHIDYIVKRAIGLGVDPITAVKVACHNAARYFLLNNRGAIAPGYLGDFVIIDNFQDFHIEKVFKKGELMVDHGVVRDFPAPAIDPYLTERAHSTFHVAAPDGGGLHGGPAPGHHRHGERGDHHRGRRVLRPDRRGVRRAEDRRGGAPQEHPPHRHRLPPGLRPEVRRRGHLRLPRLPQHHRGGHQRGRHGRRRQPGGGAERRHRGLGRRQARGGGAAGHRRHHERRAPDHRQREAGVRQGEGPRPGRQPGHRPLHDPELHGPAGDPLPADHHPGRVRRHHPELCVRGLFQ